MLKKITDFAKWLSYLFSISFTYLKGEDAKKTIILARKLAKLTKTTLDDRIIKAFCSLVAYIDDSYALDGPVMMAEVAADIRENKSLFKDFKAEVSHKGFGIELFGQKINYDPANQKVSLGVWG